MKINQIVKLKQLISNLEKASFLKYKIMWNKYYSSRTTKIYSAHIQYTEALFSIFWAKPYLGTRVIMGSKTTIWVYHIFLPKNSANWVHTELFRQKKWVKNERDHFFLAHRIYLYFLSLH